MTSFAFSYPVYPFVKVSPWDDVRVTDQTKGPLSVMRWWLEVGALVRVQAASKFIVVCPLDGASSLEVSEAVFRIAFDKEKLFAV